MTDMLEALAARTLERLCGDHPDRHVGGPGNRAATAFFAEHCAACGLEVERTPFDCVDWVHGEASLEHGGSARRLLPGPYSLPFDGEAALSAADSVDAIEAGGHEGGVLLLHGAVAAEQLMPKNFTLFNPASHRRIVAALESARPAVVIAATGRNPELAGSVYPFPLIEDGDFDIPNAYTTDVEGEALLKLAGERVRVRIDSGRVARTGEHVVARARGTGDGRVIVFGHIDSKWGSPGALDNATGAAAVFVLAELLRGWSGARTVELVPLNGEDDYAAHGHVIFLAQNHDRFDDMVLCLNSDAPAHRGHATSVSLYGASDALAASVREAMASRPGFAHGPQWPQSDHSILAMRGIPAVAVTSEDLGWLCSEITHTPKDVPELVDPAVIAQVALFFRDLCERV